MIVLIDGPTAAGKTTLAEDLARRFDLEYAHEGPPPADVAPLAHYGCLLDDARHRYEATDRGSVFDRFARGERVYGPLIRGRDGLGADGWRVFQRLARAAGVHQVLCLPSFATCRAANARAPHGVVRDEATFVAAYDAWIAQRDAGDWPGVYVYDRDLTDDVGLDAYLTTPRATLSSPLVGSPSAGVLLVGDQAGDVTVGPDLAFFSTGGSSRYLTAALDAAGISESSVAFVNARDRHGRWNAIPSANGAGVPWRVVALGRVAAAACRARGIACREVSHPQFWRRFHYADMMTYARQLRRAVMP